MFDAFKVAKISEVEVHVKNMITAWASIKDILEETMVFPADRIPNVLNDFVTEDIFETTQEVNKHVAFHAALRKFQNDLTQTMTQITEEFQMKVNLKSLNKSKAWLDENLAYVMRERRVQLQVSETLRSKLKPVDHEQN